MLILWGVSSSLLAQLSIESGNTDYTITFDETFTGVNESYYQGDGFVPDPSAGQLDSDAWATQGMSNGDSDFGDSNTDNDFARGLEPGGVITGGFYSFETTPGNYTFGIQPGGTDWTPGSVTLRIQNNTGFPMFSIDLAYVIFVLNDEARSSSFNFSHSPDNITYIDEPSLDYVSPTDADTDPVWVANNKSITLTGFYIADGEYYYLRWSGNDVSGTDRRDEFGLDDITINVGVDSNNPPVITDIASIPANPNSSETVNITAVVTDADGTVDHVEMRWGLTSGLLVNTINMSVVSGDTYITNNDIPAFADNTIVYFEIFAEDDDGESTTTPEQFYEVNDPVTTTLPYEQPFETDLGDCNTYSVSGDTKYWHWGNDGSARANGFNSGDVEEDWLFIPGIDFDNYSDVFMVFETYYNYGNTDDDTDHYLKLFYSTDYSGTGDPSGYTWTELSFEHPETSQTYTTSGIIDLSALSGITYIAFKYRYTDTYREWRVDNILIQESGAAPEPTNYPLDFMAETLDAASIELTWTDDTIGEQLPTGYLILSNLTGNFTAPTDTVPVSNDIDMSDGEGAMNIPYGDESFIWFNLAASKQYFYTIYPYSNSGTTIDYKTDGTAPTADATTDNPAPVVINEINADPDPVDGDANGDGVVDTSQDEFVELVNSSAMAIDLSHYTLSDGFGIRHEFPSGTILQPGDAVVVFGGGTPTGFDYYEVQVASTGSLGLNNDGDVVSVHDTHMELVATVTYGPEAGNNQSLTRSPDFTGMFVLHTEAAGSDGMLYSPNLFLYGNWFKEATVWSGNMDDNAWENEGNWSAGIPDTNSRTVIPAGLSSYPTLTAEVSACNSLLMESGASLVGAAFLPVNGYAEVERTIESLTEGMNGFHFLSSPVSAMAIAGSAFEPSEDTDFLFEWDETTNNWLSYSDGLTDTVFSVGKGYLVGYNPGITGSFYGDLNTDGVALQLSFTPDEGDGWNFLGNPYTSAIDWNLLAKTEEVDGAVYVLRGSDNTYVSWNGEIGDLEQGLIPVNNGFYVKAASAGQSVIIEPTAQTHSNTGFMKNSREEEPLHTLKISIANDDYTNNTYLQFREDATFDFDNDLDAYKLFGESEAPQLFTSINNDPYSINCLPFSLEEIQVPLGFSNSVASTYMLSAEGFETFLDANFEVTLEDTETGNFINIELGPYTFSADAQDYPDRFILHFYGVTSTNEKTDKDGINIFSGNQSIVVAFDQMPLSDVEVKVYNVVGQQLYTEQMAAQKTYSFRFDEKPGYYLVKVSSAQGVWVEKVYVR